MKRIAVLTLVLVLNACAGGGGALPSHGSTGSAPGAAQNAAPGTTPTPTPGNGGATVIGQLGAGKITHVIVLVQENRTFDNLFHGFPGAETASTGVTHTGAVVPLTAGPLEEPYDLGHTHTNFETEYDGGKNDGFDLVPTSPASTDLAPYRYVPQAEVQPYFDIATEFTVVVNAVGASPYYANTVIFVTWDDWGGWYDHVVPTEYGIDGTGFRVPLLVVSPWSRHGYVSKPVHEFGSILRFTEELYHLGSLGTRDASSDDLADCFDFTQTPPAFKPITLTTPPLNLHRLAMDTRPNDNY